jgi:hypothetical protein
LRKAKGIFDSRAGGVNKKETSEYFVPLKKALLENNLMKKPGHILNLSETDPPAQQEARTLSR